MSSQKSSVTRKDWKISEMPEKNVTFILERIFSDEEIMVLRRGHIPEEMEDKWFWFMEGDTFYAHRSWTGICVFRIDFSFADNRHRVTMNNDPNQVSMSVDDGKIQLSDLLNWWSQPSYDHYGEWIFEVAASLKKNGVLKEDTNN